MINRCHTCKFCEERETRNNTFNRVFKYFVCKNIKAFNNDFSLDSESAFSQNDENRVGANFGCIHYKN